MSNHKERDSLRFLRRMVDLVPPMLAYCGSDLRCKYANRGCQGWFRRNQAQWLGSTLPDLLGPELFSLDEPFIARVLLGKEQEFERVMAGPNGALRCGLVHYVPNIVDGEVVGFGLSVTEVTRLGVNEVRPLETLTLLEAET